jgi:hypothetical protein
MIYKMEYSKEEKKENTSFEYLAHAFWRIFSFIKKKLYLIIIRKYYYLTVEDKESELDYKYFEENSKYDTYYNNGNDNYSEIQVQTNKQRLKQLESQTYINRTMANIFAVIELYALSGKCANEQIYKNWWFW